MVSVLPECGRMSTLDRVLASSGHGPLRGWGPIAELALSSGLECAWCLVNFVT